MQNKLQELTDKLYQEGLSKGKAEAEQILAAARGEADKIIADAHVEAGRILAQADADAKAAASKLQSDTLVACRQSIACASQDIQNLIITKIAREPASKALSDVEFLKTLATEVAKAFTAQGAKDLDMVFSENVKKDIQPYVEGALAKAVGTGITASFSKKISGGFTVAPKGEGYFISFTEDTFKELVSEYMRPATKKILFG